MPQVQPIPNAVADLGEGPHWDVETQSLYFIDINGPIIFRYDYKEDKTYQTKIENETFVGFITPIELQPNRFAVGLMRRVAVLEWDGRSENCKVLNTLFEVDKETGLEENRINDAKADPQGRFFGGSMTAHLPSDIFAMKRTGNLYRWQRGGSPTKLRDNIGISNGLAWNTHTKKFYYIDSVDLEIKEYDYDAKTGEISHPKVLCDFRVNGSQPGFVPDGMTIDKEGFLFVATFGGSKVLKVNPKNGNIEQEIKMPCEQITSVAFGGPNLDILYVTTSRINDKPAPAGQTFKVTGLETKGLEMYKLKI